MRRTFLSLLLAASTASLAHAAEPCRSNAPAGVEADRIMAVFDSSREIGSSSETVVRLTDERRGRKRVQDFRILDSGTGQSLVEFLDPQQRGTRVLADGDHVWFYAPRTRRAIRVPPIQRVFGQASYGDLTQMVLSQDYKAAGDVCMAVDGTVRVALEARDESATYARINLWVDAGSLLPRRAHYFVASGKHIKTAEFPEAKKVDGVAVLGTWYLSEPDDRAAITLIETVSYRLVDVAARTFSRRALERGL